MIAKEIMSKNVITVGKDASIEEVARLLTKENISGVPVIDDKGALVGIISEKDLIYKDVDPKLPSYVEVLGGVFFVDGIKEYEQKLKKLLANKAEDIMTSQVITVGEDIDVKEIAELMIEKSINRVPVLKDDKLVGIVSRGDIVRSLIKK